MKRILSSCLIGAGIALFVWAVSTMPLGVLVAVVAVGFMLAARK